MKDYFEQTVEKTMRLIAIDSVQSDPCPASPFGEGVAKCLDFVCETAKEMGMSVNNEKGYYCTCDIGEGETFGILGHIDVVPYDDDWSANPLGEIRDNTLYTRRERRKRLAVHRTLQSNGHYACPRVFPRRRFPRYKLRKRTCRLRDIHRRPIPSYFS